MVLAVPKVFIMNSLLDSKLSDSLFIINPFIMDVISINVKKSLRFKKYQKYLKKINIDKDLAYYNQKKFREK